MGPDVQRNLALPHCGRHQLGAMDRVCPFCGAKHWAGERLSKSSNTNPVFGSCCKSGTVRLPPWPRPPPYLETLFSGTTAESRRFLVDVRQYNSVMQMASTGLKVDGSLTGGVQSLRMHGGTYHRIGALHPEPGQQPRFAQLYIYDSEAQRDARMQAFGTRAELDPVIVGRLGDEMAAHNLFVGVLQAAASLGEVADVHLRIRADPGAHVYTFMLRFPSPAGFREGVFLLAVTWHTGWLCTAWSCAFGPLPLTQMCLTCSSGPPAVQRANRS